MALTSWKVFNFFDVTEVTPPDPSLFDNAILNCIASGSESLFLGTTDGRIHVLSSSFKSIRSFDATEPDSDASVVHMKQVDGTALLVTIVEDLRSEPVLKVWALDKVDKKTGAPKCLSTINIQNARRQFPITAFAALDDLSQLAIGFGNGSVTVVRGDLIHDRGTRQRTVFESEEPITGVEFREGNNTMLFLATTARILTLTISGRGQGQPPRPIDDHGCDAGCMAVDKDAGEIIVGRNDALYYYRANGRRQPYAYEGGKQLVRTFGPYVAVVSPPQSSAPGKSSTFRLFGSRQADDSLKTSTFAVLDTDLHFVAHTENMMAQVRYVFMEWGDLFLLTLDGKLFRYHEKTIHQKLEVLYERNLYIEAINIAQKANLDSAQRNLILRRYGDYLYRRGDYDTAMQQYLKAIDNTEPSQVIRKFLDTRRIYNLIEYLEELHDHDHATVDHTTLLLNCYAKLKDTKKLENFINSGSNFDFDTAITMCRQGGYYRQAVFLSQKHGEHDIVVDILIEDSKEYAEALNYIWSLPPDAAYPNLMKYARVLLENCQEETTKVFIDYYTGNYKPRKDQPVVAPSEQRTSAASALPSFSSFIPKAYRQTGSAASGASKPLDPNDANLKTAEEYLGPSYEVPKPRTAFSAFVGHPDQFIRFLESCIDQEFIEESDKTDLHTTLFEMYLDFARTRTGSERMEWEAKAKTLIDSKQVPIDPSNVLLLSHLTSYDDGTILVREQQGLRFDIFRSYTAAHDTAGAIKALKKYGPEEPALYPAALTYFTSREKILEEAGSEVDVVLKKIHADGLMAPLQVIQTLSTNGVATMGLIKRYLGDTIEREKKDIETNRKIAASYRNSTATKREELTSLATKPTQFTARRCSLCGASLDLPTVHFLCKHSFHQRCLNTSGVNAKSFRSAGGTGDEEEFELDVQCPVCEKENETLKAIRQGQIDRAGRHELFLDALHRSKDGIGTVSEFFGSGVMSVESAKEEAVDLFK